MFFKPPFPSGIELRGLIITSTWLSIRKKWIVLSAVTLNWTQNHDLKPLSHSEAILKKKKKVLVYSWTNELCVTPCVLGDWHCSSAVVTARKTPDSEMSHLEDTEQSVWLLHPMAGSQASGIFPLVSVDPGPDPRETHPSFLSVKSGKPVPCLIRVQAHTSSPLLETSVWNSKPTLRPGQIISCL